MAAFCAALVGIGGCDTGKSDRNGDGSAVAGVSRTASVGSVRLTLTATPAEIELAADARIEVEVEVVAESGVTLIDESDGDVNDYDRMLTEGDRRFEYRATRLGETVAQPAAEGSLRWLYRYELEFFLPGEYELPGVSAVFADTRDADGESPAPARSVTTDPLMIVVRAPAGQSLSEEDLRQIPVLPPVELPRRWSRWWWLVPPIAVAMAAAVVLLLVRARSRRPERVVVVPPHEWAQGQLAALVAEDLLGRGLIQEFYYRISGIVRGYIERRFGVSAPEMTTEEFLSVAASDPRFADPLRPPDSTVGVPGARSDAFATELREFLTACDLVKYARHEPGRAQCDVVLVTAGEFVERTRNGQPRAMTGAGSGTNGANEGATGTYERERAP